MRARWLALGVLVSGEGPSSLLELTEANFDVLLREVPVALVAYVNPTTDLHYPRLRPNLLALADAYAHAGIGVGTVSSQWAELLDVNPHPTVLYFAYGKPDEFVCSIQRILKWYTTALAQYTLRSERSLTNQTLGTCAVM